MTPSAGPKQEAPGLFRRLMGKGIVSGPVNLRGLYLLQGGYLLALVAIFTISGIGLTPGIIFLFLAIGFAWRGTRWPFIRDFAPFIFLLLSYEAMRGFADELAGRVYVDYPIAMDKALFFGHVPTAVLQDWLYDPDATHWYDYGARAMHIQHFMVPLLFAAVIWQHYRQHYWPFMTALLLMSYAGFITFMLLPTAPPWWAGLTGDLPGVTLTHENVFIYRDLSPNPVAAMPSLHAAYPWLFLLFGFRIWGRRAIPLALYPAAVYFSVTYLGHHYVVDLLAGMLYATAAYVIVCSPAASRLAQAVRPLQYRLRGTGSVRGGEPGTEALMTAAPGGSPSREG